MKQLTAKELASILESRGWTFTRMNSGSHAQYKHPGFRELITIAGHGNRPIPPGLLRKILRQADINPKDL